MDLNELREKLDIIDNELLKLLNKRMEIVKEVGVFKAKTKSAIYRPEREKDIIQRLSNLSKENSGLLTKDAIEAIFLEIFAVSRNLELPENVAYLGPKGSFTHQAARSRFGKLSSYLPIASIKGVFREVNRKNAKFGVVPIENSSNGIVSDTITSLQKYDLKIISEVILNISHSFATLAENLDEIDIIYSKDIAFEQCYEFLNDLGLEHKELIPVESTAKAAKLASENKKSAAICSSVAAKLYNLPILFDNIQDRDDNRTRFLIISDFENAPSGNDKTSILATLPNTAGALVEFLNDFYKAKINLTKIKSHIVGGISSFFIDFDGHKEDENVKEVFNKHKNSIKFLGSYVKEADDI